MRTRTKRKPTRTIRPLRLRAKAKAHCPMPRMDNGGAHNECFNAIFSKAQEAR
jgi:hypothetical protein